MADRIEAPFTAEQVEALNRYQRDGNVHPFTCRNRGDGQHRYDDTGDFGVLEATTDGWMCRDCSYTQDWAWKAMTDG